MKKYFLIFIFSLVCFLSCKTQKSIIADNFIKVTLKYRTGELKAKGFYDKENYELDTKLPVGKWIYYYKNRKVKSQGNYKVSSYVNCCTGGLCNLSYSYKIGEWKYYHANEKLKAKGVLNITQKKIKTSCEGGANINFGKVDRNWVFYDFEGNKKQPSENDINQIEKTSVIDYFDIIK